MLYLLILCCMGILWVVWYKKKSDLEPPEFSGWLPIVGHGYQFLGDAVQLYNTLVAKSEECVEKGGVATVRLGPYKFYAIVDPDDSVAIMNTCLEKNYLFKFTKPFLGNGLLIADVERWHKSRKLLNPAFSQKVLDGFITIFNSQAQNLVNKLSDETGNPFNHEELLRINNLETICSTSFDVNHVNEYSNIFKKYLSLLTNMTRRVNNRLPKFWLHNDYIYNLTREKKQFDEEINEAVGLSKRIIEKKKAERKNISKTNIKNGQSKKFIDLILDVADDTSFFSDEHIREEVDTIVLAAHGTTATSLTYTLTVLGSHADVQEKLYEEIIRVCGDSQIIDKDDLSKLVYTEAVIKETLRLYPVALILPRYIDKDVKLKNFTLKSNHDCFIFAHSIHRHSIWGADAHQFRPERWLDRETLPDPKYYAAFGLGKRSCIGKVYAMMSMKIIVAQVIRRYRVSSDVDKMVLSFCTLSKPVSGHFISLEQRN